MLPADDVESTDETRQTYKLNECFVNARRYRFATES